MKSKTEKFCMGSKRYAKDSVKKYMYRRLSNKK